MEAGAEAWVAGGCSRGGYTRYSHPVKKYLSDNKLPERGLVVTDSAPAHPPAVADDMDAEYDFIGSSPSSRHGISWRPRTSR